MEGTEGCLMWNKANSKHHIFCPLGNLDLTEEEEEGDRKGEEVDEER